MGLWFESRLALKLFELISITFSIEVVSAADTFASLPTDTADNNTKKRHTAVISQLYAFSYT